MVDNVHEDHRGNRLLAALPPETLAILDRDLRQISLAQGAVMFEPGALLDTIYFPQSGLISLVVVTRDGNTVESTTVGREGAVGLHGCMGKRHSFTRATAQIGGIFSTIGASVFGQAVDGSTSVRDLFSRYTEVLWAEAQQIAACNAVHNASARLARWLLQSADRTGDDELPVTQEYLAQMLGIRRTTVTLLAQAMQSNELIRYRRGRINIINRAGLEACACECYRIIRHDNIALAIGASL